MNSIFNICLIGGLYGSSKTRLFTLIETGRSHRFSWMKTEKRNKESQWAIPNIHIQVTVIYRKTQKTSSQAQST
ncbi:MAG: hypothetical protein ACUZ9M_08865 [Candidatus Scalindua sp.]